MQFISNALLQISLCYFTFELSIIKCTIQSQSYIELKQMKRRICLYKLGTSLFYILYAILLGIVFSQYSCGIVTIFTILDGINTTLKIIVDLLMYSQFIKMLRYFYNVKKERSKQLAMKITWFNKFIISWTIFLFFLCIYQSLTNIHSLILRVYS